MELPGLQGPLRAKLWKGKALEGCWKKRPFPGHMVKKNTSMYLPRAPLLSSPRTLLLDRGQFGTCKDMSLLTNRRPITFRYQMPAPLCHREDSCMDLGCPRTELAACYLWQLGLGRLESTSHGGELGGRGAWDRRTPCTSPVRRGLNLHACRLWCFYSGQKSHQRSSNTLSFFLISLQEGPERVWLEKHILSLSG